MRKHAKARALISAWLQEAEAGDWKTPKEVIARYRSAISSKNKVIFDLGGDGFKLAALIHYQNGVILIQCIATPEEYSKMESLNGKQTP